MKKFAYLLIFFFLIFNESKSQSFSISEIDVSEFPFVKAGFVALDKDNQSFKNLVPSDFVVIENGQYMTETLQVECKNEEVNPEVSIVLVIDQSTSMKYVDTASGLERYKWVVEGVTKFINTIKLEGRSAIAMITFGRDVVPRCDFTNNKQRLLDSLETIMWGGATDYDPPFLDSLYGAISLLKSRPSDMRRIIVFLTDGEPNQPPAVDEIIDSLKRANIQVYAITLTLPMHRDLKQIAEFTGGSAHAVFTREELDNIYTYIALDIQTKQFCNLIWEAPFGCDEQSKYREVSIDFVKIPFLNPVDRSYFAPDESISVVEKSDDILSFGDPPAFGTSSNTLSIEPTVTSTTITGADMQPDTYFNVEDWGGSAPPFVLDSGKARTITIKFTQGFPKDFRQAELLIDGEPCGTQVTLIAGYSQINVFHPNGGELYNTCETINIVWTGVDPSVPVDLYYSADGGTTWNSIASGVTGTSYDWVPPVEGTEYRVKAKVNEQIRYLWARSNGSETDDGGLSVAVADDDLHVYVVGYFSDLMKFEDQNLQSYGNTDIFLAKYDAQGNFIWAEKGGSPTSDTAKGVCVDPDGNVYVTGVCQYGSKFGSIQKTMEYQNKLHCFVAKYSENGGSPAVQLLGPTGPWSDFQARGLKIRYENGDIYVQGNYIKRYERAGKTLPNADRPEKFTWVLNASDMTVKSLYQGGVDYPDYSSNTDADKDNSIYETGTFSGTKIIGNFNLDSKGGTDFFLSKLGSTPGSEDISDNNFSVIKPAITVTEPGPLDLGQCTLNDAVSKVFGALLTNNTGIKVKIIKAEIVAPDDSPQSEYTLAIPLDGVEIGPGESVNVEIAFSPTVTGVRDAKLKIVCDCADMVTVFITGECICTANIYGQIDMGSENVGMIKDSIVETIFCNSNTSTIRITPVITGTDPNDFDLTFPDGSPISDIPVQADSCLKLRVVFKPQSSGPKSAVIDFGMPEGCETQTTDLIGNAVDADIIAEILDFGERRVLSTNDSVLVIRNNGSLPAEVKSITVISGDTEFNINTSRLKNIPGGDTMQIPVRFIPPDENLFSAKVDIDIASLSKPLTATIKGEGILPKIIPSWDCSNPVKPGQSSTAYLTVYNPSTSSELYVEKIEFETPSTEFTWESGSNPQNITIGKNTPETFNVTFAPQNTGTRSVNIIITSDAYNGQEEAPAVDTILAECDALGLSAESPIDFGAVLLCEKDTKVLKISNKGGSTPVTINSYSITGDGAEAFEADIPANLIIGAEEEKDVDITFSPTTEKTYNAILDLVNSIDQDLKVDLTGDGAVVHYSTKETTVEKTPGLYHKLTVNGEVVHLSKEMITDLSMKIIYDPLMVLFEPDNADFKFVNELPSSVWTWDSPVMNKLGEIEISGSGNLQTPFDRKFFTIDLQILLSEVATSKLTFQPVHGVCDIPQDEGLTFGLKDVCFLQGSLIRYFGTNYSISDPVPNPAGSSLTLKFGVGLEASTKIDIVDAAGLVQKNLVDKTLEPGSYELNASTENISSGIYFIRISSGPYKDFRKFIIAK